MFANPYRLVDLPRYKDFQSFIVAWSDTKFNNKAAARAIVRGGAAGVLPVKIK